MCGVHVCVLKKMETVHVRVDVGAIECVQNSVLADVCVLVVHGGCARECKCRRI